MAGFAREGLIMVPLGCSKINISIPGLARIVPVLHLVFNIGINSDISLFDYTAMCDFIFTVMVTGVFKLVH